MSLTKLVFPSLSWSELWEILGFLSLKDVWRLGTSCRSGFVTFLREKTFREGLKEQSQTLATSKFHARFLSKFSSHEKILLVSYPRSGNSFVRKMLELKTGIITGSDSRPNRTLSASLLKFGYCGEGVVDQSVWVVKSHFPERLGYIRFPVNRIVFVVRNPFDAIESYFHMGMTNTHDKVLAPEAFQSLQKIWKEFLRNEAKVWMAFHTYWLSKIQTMPITIIRYEDLLEDQNRWMGEMIHFMRQGKEPEGITRFLPRDNDNKTTGLGYNPKSSRIGKSFQSIPDEEFNFIYQETKEYLKLFNYHVVPRQDQQSIASSSSSFLSPRDCVLHLEPFHSLPSVNSCSSSLLINDHIGIRSSEDQFGRKITELRQKLTKNDQEPFATK